LRRFSHGSVIVSRPSSASRSKATNVSVKLSSPFRIRAHPARPLGGDPAELARGAGSRDDDLGPQLDSGLSDLRVGFGSTLFAVTTEQR
jgi:hypothetical protein